MSVKSFLKCMNCEWIYEFGRLKCPECGSIECAPYILTSGPAPNFSTPPVAIVILFYIDDRYWAIQILQDKYQNLRPDQLDQLVKVATLRDGIGAKPGREVEFAVNCSDHPGNEHGCEGSACNFCKGKKTLSIKTTLSASMNDWFLGTAGKFLVDVVGMSKESTIESQPIIRQLVESVGFNYLAVVEVSLS